MGVVAEAPMVVLRVAMMEASLVVLGVAMMGG